MSRKSRKKLTIEELKEKIIDYNNEIITKQWYLKVYELKGNRKVHRLNNKKNQYQQLLKNRKILAVKTYFGVKTINNALELLSHINNESLMMKECFALF